MENTKRKKILPEMFDIRHVTQDGGLDMGRIHNIRRMSEKTKVTTKKKKKPSATFFQDIRRAESESPAMPPAPVWPIKTIELPEIPPIDRWIKDDLPLIIKATSSIGEKTTDAFKEKLSQPANAADIRPIKAPIVDISRTSKKAYRAELDSYFYQPEESFSEESRVVDEIESQEDEKNFESGYAFFQQQESLLSEKLEAESAPIVETELLQEIPIFDPPKTNFSFRDVLSFGYFFDQQSLRRTAASFAAFAGIIFLLVFGMRFTNRGLELKDAILTNGESALGNLAQAKEAMMNRNFQGSAAEFNTAYEKFGQMSEDFQSLGGKLIDATSFLPYLSKLSSGNHLAAAGKDFSRVGVLASEVAGTLNDLKNPLANGSDSQPISLLQIFQQVSNNSQQILALLDDAQDNVAKVSVDDLPEKNRAQFVLLKSKLPEIREFLDAFNANSQLFADILGGNGPRKYLFLFQNNQEMRATGGFIGSYGVLDIADGRIRKFYIDGIYNPDGQLRDNIVPPAPIQKISAAWSLHDSNWFPNFPQSAEEANRFFEKTGGPTVDGVITMTPTVMEKLLEVTGPIEMPEYGLTINADNFIEETQQEVEVNYDKEVNQPKKILADLAPKILDELFNAKSIESISKTLNVLAESLDEKQILLYSDNYDIEKLIAGAGWSGEVLNTQKDYVSVINTNINGYKTDGVVDEKIEHLAEFQSDGSVIDTLTITRHHNGGNMAYDWWNKVNSDYMRVYVPKGSKLLSAEGQTKEFNSPPLDYDALGFNRDPLLQMEEDGTRVDDETGTRIYDENNKTVFANWVYVSPQETVTVKYRYLLPFRVAVDRKQTQISTYSLLAQKQSGSVGSEFHSAINFPNTYKLAWKFPDELNQDGSAFRMDTDLKTDKFIGLAFTPQ